MFVSKIFSSVRYSLIAINLLFLLTGIVIFSVGVSVQVAYNDYYHFLVQRFFSLPAFLITIGVFIFLISAFGFAGAAFQSYYMNMVYVILMVVIFIFEMSACIAGYVLHSSTVMLLQSRLLETITLYGTNTNLAVTMLWDEVQRDFECCGVTQPSDWNQALPDPAEPTGNNDIPLSCCAPEIGAMGTFTCNATNAFATGCASALGEWVAAHALGMAAAGLIICLIQFVAAGGSAWVARRSKFEDLN